ncbi:hypothetical protein [Pseudonocardia zijingensis]|uniref:CopG family transcriptional regulator n=1 Tax=Pseudonocardia zijingensis TaxID=153376 RepID=A0ABP3ZVE8_9PSEU
MTTADPSPTDETSPAQLLLDAVDALPARDRNRVLLWLLDPASAGPRAGRTLNSYSQALLARVPELSPTASEHIHERWSAPRTEDTGDERMHVVPIRLGGSQYRRLRSWCTQHNFSMATVVRGLVDQFLDRQDPQPRVPEHVGN